MEKRRRDRINSCLATLSSVLLKAEDISPSTSRPSTTGRKRAARLEKADILEQTVLHFHRLSEQRKSLSELHVFQTQHMQSRSSYSLGYESCIRVIDSFLRELGEDETKSLRGELTSFLTGKLKELSPPKDGPHSGSSKREKEPTSRSQDPIKERVTFVPQILSDGSLALVIKDESEKGCGEEILVTRDPILPLPNEDLCGTSDEEMSENELDDSQLISECLENVTIPTYRNEDQNNVWRPWNGREDVS